MFPPDTKILIIDDMITMRKLIRKQLYDLGFTITQEAADGVLGWAEIEKAMASNAPFTLIVSDWNMPNMSGLDLLRKVRAQENLKKLPFILITAETEMPQVMEAIKSGVTTYVTKPFSPATFKEKLTMAWTKSR
jgi:two-component system, chemotaxis family, chemotaxis protein CheY